MSALRDLVARFGRRGGVPSEVLAQAGLPAKDRVLAAARTTDGGWVVGTRTALVAVAASPIRVRWEEIQHASWSVDDEQLRVTEVGEFGQTPTVHALSLHTPAMLLQLVQDRVTASIVLQHHTDLGDAGGFRVIARRSPTGSGAIRWSVEYDVGTEPAAPVVAQSVADALARARADLGG